MGILFAFIALFGWGFADYYIQKTSRVTGSTHAIFYIALAGTVALFPFIYQDIFSLQAGHFLLLGLLGIVAIFEALFDVEALRQGKISIVEPVFGLELPLTVALSITLAKEQLTAWQLVLILIVTVGLILAITDRFSHLHYHRRLFERGVMLAGLGAVGLALTNFLIGVASQQISPLMAIWSCNAVFLVVISAYIFIRGGFPKIWSDFKRYPKLIICESVLDNIGWLAFACATALIPISIATTISESYIALTVLLGLFVSREKIKRHQAAGIVIAVAGVIALSYLFA